MTMMAPQPQPLPAPAAAFGDTTLTKVFVGGLAWETHKDTLREHFERYGDILEAVIISDKLTGRSKGYGFVSSLTPPLSLASCTVCVWHSSDDVCDVCVHGRDATGDVQGGRCGQESVRGRDARHQRPPRQLQPGVPRRQAARPVVAPLPPVAARARTPFPAPARAG
jgi:hypothetical protein